MARRSPDISQLPLNALRAFEASARHLSFTRAGLELRVSQAAVSQQVKVLETSLRIKLFRRLTRGLALTEEGEAHERLLSGRKPKGQINLEPLSGAGVAPGPTTLGPVGARAAQL